MLFDIQNEFILTIILYYENSEDVELQSSGFDGDKECGDTL